LSHLATNPDGILDALDHSHPLMKVLGTYLPKKHRQMTAEEKSLDLIFGVVCVTAQPSSTGSRKCEKDNEERSIVMI
jgi:hypothetical protein